MLQYKPHTDYWFFYKADGKKDTICFKEVIAINLRTSIIYQNSQYTNRFCKNEKLPFSKTDSSEVVQILK